MSYKILLDCVDYAQHQDQTRQIDAVYTHKLSIFTWTLNKPTTETLLKPCTYKCAHICACGYIYVVDVKYQTTQFKKWMEAKIMIWT